MGLKLVELVHKNPGDASSSNGQIEIGCTYSTGLYRASAFLSIRSLRVSVCLKERSVLFNILYKDTLTLVYLA